MLSEILAEYIASLRLPKTFFSKISDVFANYLSIFMKRYGLAIDLYHNYLKILLLSPILCFSLLSICFAYPEICSFDTSQSCELHDCNGTSWYIDNSVGYPESPSLHSGAIQNGGESGLCRNFTGPATITFWWCAESINFCLGELFFLVDGQKKYACASSKWEKLSYTIRDNKSHTISWIFRKFKSYPEYVGGGWIDNLSIESLNHLNASLNVRRAANTTNGNVSLFLSNGTDNPIFITLNPKSVIINATNMLINSSVVRLNSTEMKTDNIDISTNLSRLDVSSTNFSTNINSEVKISRINDVYVDRILDTSNNKSPQILLKDPQNESEFKINDSVNFTYVLDPNSNRILDRCSLCFNGLDVSNKRINGHNDIFYESFNYTLGKDQLGLTEWSVRCTDNASRIFESDCRRFSVFLNSSLMNVTNESEPDNYNFSSISDALKNAPPHSTIMIYKKLNNEHIIINKSINLIGIGDPTILNKGKDREIILLNGSDVSIKGIRFDANSTKNAINISGTNSTNINISNNIILNGVKAIGVNNISVVDNIITIANQCGIRVLLCLERCSGISCINNTITGHSTDQNVIGIYLKESDLRAHDLFDNNISKVTAGVQICSADLSEIQCIKSENNITNINGLENYNVREECL